MVTDGKVKELRRLLDQGKSLIGSVYGRPSVREIASAASSKGILFSAEVIPTEAAKRDL
jgi:hypothetical protein